MAATYDVIVIGGGHSGLVSAALLARQGRRVLVVERRSVVGGRLSPCEPFPGFLASPCFDDAGRLRPQVENGLELSRRGLRWRATDPLVLAPLPEAGKGSLALWRDEKAAAAEIARFSARDAQRWPEYLKIMRKAARFADPLFDMALPELGTTDPSQLLEAGRLGLRFRMLGRDDMVMLMRLATLSVADWLDEWFETPLLKAALAAPALTGGVVGPHAPATAGLLAWRQAAGQGDVPVGGGAAVVKALLEDCLAVGVEVRTGTEVKAVEVTEGRASGVRLADGTAITGSVIVADIDPRRAMLDLVPPGTLPARCTHAFRSLRSRGICARLFISMSELPRFICLDEGETARLGGRIHFGRTLRDLEVAYDDAKYKRGSRAPVVEMWIPSLADPTVAPGGRHLISLTVTSAPPAGGSALPGTERNAFIDGVIDFLATYIPNLKTALIDRAALMPTDLEAEYGLSGGHLHHGEIALDQLFITRPSGATPRYKTPLNDFYLTGAGTHPGGPATGASGALCALEVDTCSAPPGPSQARNRHLVTTAVGVGLALVGAGLAARGALQKLKRDEPAAPTANEGGQR